MGVDEERGMGEENGRSEEEDGGQRSVHGTLKPGSSHGNQRTIRSMGLRIPAMKVLRGSFGSAKSGRPPRWDLSFINDWMESEK